MLDNPWTLPMTIKISFFNLKKVFLNVENLFLFNIIVEEKTKSKATKNLISKIFLNLSATIKKNTKNGRQNKLYSLTNFGSLTFDFQNCKILIVIDIGMRMFMVFAKS